MTTLLERRQHARFVFQCFDVLLNANSFESFRAPTLGNVMRLRELMVSIGQVTKHESRHQILRSIIDESLVELEKDTVFISILDDLANPFLAQLKSCNISDYASIDKLYDATSGVINLLNRFYKARIENELIHVFAEPKQKLEAYDLARRYISHLLNMGYSIHFIRATVRSVLTNNVINSKLLRSFISKFQTEEIDYEVIEFYSHKSAATILKVDFLKVHMKRLSDLPQSVMSTKSANISTDDCVLLWNVKARDPYCAADSARNTTHRFLSVSVLEDKRINLTEKDFIVVRQKFSKSCIVVKNNDHVLQKTTQLGSKRSLANISRNVDSLFQNFERGSVGRALIAMDSAQLAQKSTNTENQITLLWSSIEALFGDPHKGVSRIAYYLDCMSPCIMLNYPWRFSLAVFNFLNRNHRTSIKDACDIAGIDQGLEPIRRFINFVIDPEHAQHHAILTSRLANSPYDLQLLFRFHRSFANLQMLRRTFFDHESRIRWQIERIYRARNDFIHTGVSAPFTSQLSHNAYDYFKTTISALIFHSGQMSAPSRSLSIEEVKESIRLNLSYLKLILSSENKRKSDVDLTKLFVRK